MSYSPEEMEEFNTEATELLENAEKNLLMIDCGGDFSQIFDSVFRCFHNLKGAAGMMELTKLQSHTHELETILMKFKTASTIPKEYVDLFLKGIDGSRTLLEGKEINFDYTVDLKEEGKELNNSKIQPAPFLSILESPAPNSLLDASVVEFFSECDEIIERVSSNLQKIESKDYSKDTIDGLYRDFHSLKGTAYLFSFINLGNIAHAIETGLEPIRNGTNTPSSSLVDCIFKAIKVIELEIQDLKTGEKNSSIEKLIAVLVKSLGDSTSNLEVIQTQKESTEAPSHDHSQPTPVNDDSAALKTQNTNNAATSPSTGPAKEKDGENSSIRVSVALLDNLMALMGEMVLVRNQVMQFSSNSDDLEFQNLSKHLNVVTSEIQDEMMKTRMQPIGNVLSKFSRVARDLSQELGKSISLVLSGAETELDKSLLEAIKDPLTHIVRNSCDHGIETLEGRRNAGKPETGTITIKSFHEGGQVVIEVSDDGKGLNVEALLKKGIEKGLITEAQSKQMAEKDIFQLIFAPGFSTAQKVTNVSGRGVGMDVVRTNIEKIGGTVDLESVLGSGTTIRMKIPLTLAIIPALIINSGTGTFAIPQVKLAELVRVDQSSDKNKIEYLQNTPVYRLRGNILPLIDLNKILGLKSTNLTPSDSIINIAVLNAEHCTFGLIVDEVQDTADIVVKPLNRLLKTLQLYSGATILGDGSVALILDVLGLSKVAKIGREEVRHEQIGSISDSHSKISSNEIQDYILVKLNSSTKHAIVLGYVHRLEEFKRSEIELSGNQRVIRYRNAILPIVNANTQLGYASDNTPQDMVPIIVIEKAGTFYGIEVDEILDTLSTTVDLDTSLVKQPGIFGNLNTSEELVVVMDPFEMILSAYPNTNIVEDSVSKFSKQEKYADLSIPQCKPLRILLAEDTVFFRKAILKILHKVGHQVTVANDGKEAIDLFKASPKSFDLLVSDIEMPRMNGFELAKAIRANSVNSEIPMLAISSRADANYTKEGIKAGFNVYMEKLKPTLLLDAIENITQNRKDVA